VAISRKTAAEFAADLVAAIQSRNANYDTSIGPIPDLTINPLSNVLELQNDRIRSVQSLISLQNDGSFTDDDLNSLVFNENMVRLSGGQALVNLVFSRATIPSADITVKANFPVATLPDETTNVSVTFLTTQDATLVVANLSSYFNPTTQRYELIVPAISLTGTSVGNVAANRIVRPLKALSGFDAVFNRDAAVGGKDPENKDDLISRYLLSLTGSSPAVVDGIKKVLRNQFPAVVDSNIVFGNNPLNIRSATDGGAVDAYVIGDAPTTVTEIILFPGAAQPIALKNQPVEAILSAGIYVQGTDFQLYKDASGYAGSVRGRDGLQFLTTGTLPTVGSPVSVIYTYNSLMGTLQNAFMSDSLNSPGEDLLYKAATKVNVSLVAQIKFRSGYNVAQALNIVTLALSTFINALKLGEDVEQSDLQLVVRSFTAVDNFIITNLSKVGLVANTDLSINANEYSRIDNANLSVSVI
jgi:hypothetical protein